MKVAYLLNSVSRKAGGLLEICRRLAQTSCRRNEIVVLGVEDEFTNADIKEWTPLRPVVFQAVFLRSFGYAAGYGKYLAETSPDIAHVHGLWTYPSLAGYLWRRRTKRPLIYTAHGMLDPWALRNSAWKKRLVRALWEDTAHRSAKCFHVNSEEEYLTLRRHGLRNPICVIPNGADLPRAVESSELRVESSPFEPFAQGRKVLLYLGRLHPKKNLANLIHGWKATLNSQLSTINCWILAIVGWDQGGYKDELEKLASDLGLPMTVAFVGPRFGADRDACYRACNAVVMPSFSEGLPMTVLEAWAHAKPVLMTPECNLPEGFAAGAALCIGTEATDIAKGLKQLFEMVENDRKEMGARGRTLVTEKFSWPRIGEQMRAVYEWALGGGAPPDTVCLN
jgi:glycosyltransferase involved in cell wall biosynthesis